MSTVMSKPSRKAPKTRAEIKQATRATLIQAGIAEFSVHGFEASLDSICARAKLTRGAFYVHFADRDAFIVAVMQHVLGTFVSAMTDARPTGNGLAMATEVFFAAARSQAPVVRGAAGLRFHHLMEACRRSKVIGETYRNLVMMGRGQLASVLAADQQRGVVRDDLSSDALADLLSVLALGTIAALELELPIDVARLGRSVLAIAGRA
jgi:TetR/AcrR family transcriptional repressor of nem operon